MFSLSGCPAYLTNTMQLYLYMEGLNNSLTALLYELEK